MAFQLEVIKGNTRDHRFELRRGLTIGRTQGDIQLNDPKVSNIHALISQTDDEHWYLINQGSANGIRVNGEKMNKVRLSSGLIIQLGNTFMQIVNKSDELELTESTSYSHSIESPRHTDNSSQSFPLSQTPDDGSRKDAAEQSAKNLQKMLQWLSDAKHLASNHPQQLTPFFPGIELHFLQGFQTGTVWTLAYGPRDIGANCPDLPIFERNAPGKCFQLRSERHSLIFSTKHDDIVEINGQSLPESIIKDRDRIQVFDTILEVRFLK